MSKTTEHELRLFLGCPLPDNWRDALKKFTEFNPAPGKSWIDEDNLHITTLYIGRFPEQHLDYLAAEIEKRLKNFSAVPLSFDSIVYAPEKNRARMVWAQFNEEPAFTALCRELWHCC